MNERLEAALRYAQERGWAVLPLNGKVPIAGSHGYKDATTDESKIRAWWEADPDRNVGVATGVVSGIVVVDVDGPEGEDALEELLGSDEQKTLQVRTPRGRHLYFGYPTSGPPIGRKIGLREKLDLLGEGGYVVAPPSVNQETGAAYKIASDQELAPLPDVLLSLATSIDEKRLFRVPERLEEPHRNTTLYRLGRFMRDKGASHEAIRAALIAENNAKCHPPIPQKDVVATARSAAQHEVTDPMVGFNLLTDEQLLTLPDPEWLVSGHLPAGGLAVLYGKPGSGKSFLALDWSMHVATGKSWLERFDVRPGPVLYVIAEGGTSFKLRVQAWHDAFKARPPTGAFFLLNAVNLMDLDEVTDLVLQIAAQMPGSPALVVFDTLARSMAGGDENTQKDMGKAVAGADRVRHETGATVLLPHHSRRADAEERGSSVLRGAADAMFEIKNDGGALTVSCTKMKDAEPPNRTFLTLTPKGASCVIQQDVARSATPQERLIDFLTAHPGSTTTEIRSEVGGKAEAVGKLLADLTERGWIEDRGRKGKHRWYRTEEDDVGSE